MVTIKGLKLMNTGNPHGDALAVYLYMIAGFNYYAALNTKYITLYYKVKPISTS